MTSLLQSRRAVAQALVENTVSQLENWLAGSMALVFPTVPPFVFVPVPRLRDEGLPSLSTAVFRSIGVIYI